MTMDHAELTTDQVQIQLTLMDLIDFYFYFLFIVVVFMAADLLLIQFELLNSKLDAIPLVKL